VRGCLSARAYGSGGGTGWLDLFEVIYGDDEDGGAADLFFDGSGDVHFAGLHDGGQGSDVLDAAGAAFAEDGQDILHLFVLDAAEDGCVADAQEAAAGAGNGSGVAAPSEAIEQIRAVFFVDDGDYEFHVSNVSSIRNDDYSRVQLTR